MTIFCQELAKNVQSGHTGPPVSYLVDASACDDGKVFAPDDPDVIVSIVNADADVAFVYDRSKGEDEDADGEVDDSIAVIVSDRLLPIFRIFLKNGPIQASFCFFVLFSLQLQ